MFHNKRTLNKYKRECKNNDKNFTTKRCLEDGEKKYRDHIYLIKVNEKNKTYQRIENLYTLYQLGYARPSREDEYCFSKKDYTMEERIKIYDFVADIKDILKLKD